MTIDQRFDEPRDQFPVGMRVLAVDDDPTCLMLLGTLLRKCQYHVTTTSQAIMALKLLRENKNKFDLVISDVHMPDMDGFKLLELVGLEMDLPVIMLSVNGDSKLVMKGITHGACDYLLKPVRIEELKNIWQHVVRRKKFDCKEQNISDKRPGRTGEGEHESTGTENSVQHGMLDKKRKEQNENEYEEDDENGHDNEDRSTQKKPRVVWSVELHRKFVAAVKQLGIDKAVPKRILELMNVDKLSRENVASHLQKYRLYLKRINYVERQQSNMAVAFGNADSSYLQMCSLNGLGNFHSLTGPGQFQNTSFRPYPLGGMHSRLNSPAGLGIRGLSSSPGITHLGDTQHSSYSINDRSMLPPVLLSGNQNGSVLQGMPMSLEPHHLHGAARGEELSTTIDDLTGFPVSSGLSDMKTTVACSSNSLIVAPNNSFILQGQPQETHIRAGFGNKSSVTLAPIDSGVMSPFHDLGRFNDHCPSAVQSSGIQSNSVPSIDCSKRPTLYTSSLRDKMSSSCLDIGSDLHDVSSVITSAPSRLQDLRIGMQHQARPISSNAAQSVNCIPQEGWAFHNRDNSSNSNLMRSSINSSTNAHGMGPLSQRLIPTNTNCHVSVDFSLIGQTDFVDSLPMECNEVEKSALETSMKLNQGYLMGQGMAQGSYTFNSSDSLEDLASVIIKRERR